MGETWKTLIGNSPNIVEVTPSDSTAYSPPLLGVRVGTTAGAIKVTSDGVDVEIFNVQVGETVPGQITKVYNTSTTAVGLNGWQNA